MPISVETGQGHFKVIHGQGPPKNLLSVHGFAVEALFTYTAPILLPLNSLIFVLFCSVYAGSQQARIRTWLYVPSTPPSSVLALLPALDLPLWPVHSQEGSPRERHLFSQTKNASHKSTPKGCAFF